MMRLMLTFRRKHGHIRGGCATHYQNHAHLPEKKMNTVANDEGLVNHASVKCGV